VVFPASSSGRDIFMTGAKTKTASAPTKGRRLSEKLRGTTQIAGKLSPAALCAVTLRRVRLISPEAPGRLEKPSAGTPCSHKRAFSLGGIACFSDPILAICHNPSFRTKGQIIPLRSIQIIAWPRRLSTGFPQILRHPDAVCMGHLAVLDGHGRVSRIPPITIFLIAHCIADRPVSLYDHRVGFKVCCAVR